VLRSWCPWGRGGSRRCFAIALVAASTLLGACTSGGPTPAIAIDLDASVVEVVRGGSVEVTVTLTRSAGAADPVELSLTGLPAHVSASFSPATLAGAATSSTLTVSSTAEAGEGAASLTVTGSSGNLTNAASLTLGVVSLTVTGRVQGVYGRPIQGASVTAQGEVAFTTADGAFTLSGLAIPYDLVISSAVNNGAMHVFEGLTRADPVLSPSFALGMIPILDRDAALDGDVLGGGSVPDGQAVVVCIEGLAATAYGCDRVEAPLTGYAFNANWFDTETLQARIHALHVELAGDGTPAAFLGYDSIDVVLEHGVPATLDLMLAPVTETSFDGSIVADAGLTVHGALGFVRFAPNLTMAVFASEAVTEDFEVVMPDLPGVAFEILTQAGDAAGGVSFAWSGSVESNDGTITVPAPSQLFLPADAAVGVDLTTTFSAVSGGGPQTFRWYPEAAGPDLALTTSRSSVTIPNPAVAGLPLPTGATYNWIVVGHGAASVDSVGARGIADYVEVIVVTESGGPGFASAGAFTLSASREFVFAP
jgi:hypothetical protein